MKIKFANGVIKKCSMPIERKIFKQIGGSTIGVGWLLSLILIGETTSDEMDALLVDKNIAHLEFLSEAENSENEHMFSLNGYGINTSSVITYNEDKAKTTVEIQLSKGV